MMPVNIPPPLRKRLREGCVIPAHPLALDARRKLSEKHQRGLTRYYCDAGADGLAVGVHSTQFEIRDPAYGLYEPVLALAAETMDEWTAAHGTPLLKIAGVSGKREQALHEAGTAASLGYHACLLALRDLRHEPLAHLIEHARAVAGIMPVIGFYLQASVGGMPLPIEFWREFLQIERVIAIKVAPFNRYQTLDVARALCDSGRQDEIALYTGNDDNIIMDLLSTYRIVTSDGLRTVGCVGGLLGHWGVWTRCAVEQFERIKAWRASGRDVPRELLTLANEITDSNAALFDPQHKFSGCLSGINEVLYRRGQMPANVCLSSRERLSPGQAEEIDRVQQAYPHLTDDAFVDKNLAMWLS